MCGDIQPWQTTKTVTVRMVDGGLAQNVVLGNKYDNVEEVRLDEVMITGFNGAVSASAYLKFQTQGLHHGASNNEANSGLLLPIDVLNPHTVYARARVIATGHMITINTFQLSVLMPNGAAATFTEASFVLTFVMRKSPDALEETRRMNMLVHAPPGIIDVRNSYNPQGSLI